ncbi:hypothetical protein ASG25_17130 [Rhizobium sp. Leaf384]|uniref:FAD/NAD(P)-binding protein n=1 Tax=unclassified Rhizobium TaxID=2613769 RepID=UPI00071443BA|nr:MULTISPECIES: FAD/NAD(P)-binding protein [unclassified Rhizobium]KQR69326.1 hypothetical protein ASG03_09095 [Rhizobium sp. Leaf341]KQS77100.1 hypothetical protein ASG25_17130 [Rhizobium sp. Leaf384]KQS78371.1 hypothetical protein ASG58_08345 [Rhizobium sp. Leaf383]
MTVKIAIIGSGPTGIYTLHGLVSCPRPLDITVFESDADPGKGTPYHPDINDQAMLANIASIELPPIYETLVAWLRRQTDAELERMNVARDAIAERSFYPRIVLGEFFQDQFRQCVIEGRKAGHVIEIKALHRVDDIDLHPGDIAVTATGPEGQQRYAFDHVVMATGHDWPETTETRPGYFMSPWPAPVLKTIPPGRVGILGTSLSAIDALITVATAHGAFYLDAAGSLEYFPSPGTEAFSAALMSRKGVLPEADFYCPYPYLPLSICTPEAVDALVAGGRGDLLDPIFDLFRAELLAADPAYAERVGLGMLTVETLAPAYFADREGADPFVWAAANLAEAEQNERDRRTIGWRYAILRMHEVIARAVPFFNKDDLDRFHKHFKTVFIDDYATVPHQSIRRLLALRRAGKLEVLRLGRESDVDTENVDRGATVSFEGRSETFTAFIDATGQHQLSARDIPFPSLVQHGFVRKATTPVSTVLIEMPNEPAVVRTGGVDLDDTFRPILTAPVNRNLYCVSIAFLLHKLPFIQGITSAHELGGIVSTTILGEIDGTIGGAGSGILVGIDMNAA